MTFREMNLRVFQGKDIPYVLFQPRIEPWYDWHQKVGQLPERYRDTTLRGLFDDLHVSMRYVHYYTGMPDPVVVKYDQQVKTHQVQHGDRITRVTETPYGELVEQMQLTLDKTWREVDFPVKAPEDLVKLRWLYEHSHLLLLQR